MAYQLFRSEMHAYRLESRMHQFGYWGTPLVLWIRWNLHLEVPPLIDSTAVTATAVCKSIERIGMLPAILQPPYMDARALVIGRCQVPSIVTVHCIQ